MKISKYQKFNEAEEVPPVEAPAGAENGPNQQRLAVRQMLRGLRRPGDRVPGEKGKRREERKIEKESQFKSLKGTISILNNSSDFKRIGASLTPSEFKSLDEISKMYFSEVLKVPGDASIFKLNLDVKKFDFPYENLEVTLTIFKRDTNRYKVQLFDNAKNFQQYRAKKEEVNEKSLLNSIMEMIVKYYNFRVNISKKLTQMKLKFDKILGHQAIIDQFSNIFDMCDSHQVENIVFPNTVKIKLIFVSSQFKLNNLYYKKINAKYVSIFEELMTISERLSDENVGLYYHQIPNGVHILLKMNELNDILKIKKKKIDPGYVLPPNQMVEESLVDRILGKNPYEFIRPEILSLNDSPEFQKERVSIEPSESQTKFRIIYGKDYTDYRLRTGKIRKPVSVNVVKHGGGSYNISYNFQQGRYGDKMPNINKNGVPESQIKSEVERGILTACGMLNEYELKSAKASKAAGARKRSVEKKKTKFEGKITEQFIMDEFANIFDICKTYKIGKPYYTTAEGFMINVNIYSGISIHRARRRNYTKVDSKFIDFYSELMTTSERLSDQGVDMDVHTEGDGAFEIVVKVRKEEKKKDLK